MNKKAFTLAEVLITLAIIGVVAALTMPSLIAKYQEKQMLTAFKRTYSILENAYRLALYNNGDISEWAFTNDAAYNAKMLYDNMKPYLNITKTCEYSSGCFSDEVYSFNDTRSWNLNNTVRYWCVLNDGTSVGFLDKQGIYVDLNGLKKPNKVGVDIFQFSMDNGYLTMYDDKTGDVVCYTNPWTCSAWVVANGNMDYLHCNNLSWSGPTKCN